jgi:hypothetical protein
MVLPFLKAGIKVCFYPVFMEKGRLVQDFQAARDCDGLLLMDYFGYTGYSDAVNFEGICIRDLTHSVFSATYSDAQYYFGSLRKWAGFYTGGFSWGFSDHQLEENNIYTSLRREAMEQKRQYIAGLSDSKDYLAVFSQAEQMLDDCVPAAAAQEDIHRAQHLDVADMKRRRRENAAQLLEAFADVALFPEMSEQDCPLFVPIRVPDGKRDDFRRHLAGLEIYCPAHWPLTKYHMPDTKSRKLYEEELSLVCDQRYDRADMDRLIKAVKQFWKD